ncbi:hypothetical protein KKB44_02810 [Candidatus Micrarchaeota archaeon]|nr:hypothetical protein [Candidatus Micrarchaeota archaeon]
MTDISRPRPEFYFFYINSGRLEMTDISRPRPEFYFYSHAVLTVFKYFSTEFIISNSGKLNSVRWFYGYECI